MVCSDTQCCSVVEFVNPSTPASKSLLTTNFFRYDLFPKLNQKEKKQLSIEYQRRYPGNPLTVKS